VYLIGFVVVVVTGVVVTIVVPIDETDVIGVSGSTAVLGAVNADRLLLVSSSYVYEGPVDTGRAGSGD
jgi:hypothetical protein